MPDAILSVTARLDFVSWLCIYSWPPCLPRDCSIFCFVSPTTPLVRFEFSFAWVLRKAQTVSLACLIVTFNVVVVNALWRFYIIYNLLIIHFWEGFGIVLVEYCVKLSNKFIVLMFYCFSFNWLYKENT